MNSTTSRGSRQGAEARRCLAGCFANPDQEMEPSRRDGWLPSGAADLATFAVAFGVAAGGFLSRSGEAVPLRGEPRFGFSFTVRELPWGI